MFVGCGFHANESALKSVFRKIDGVTSGPKSFKGPIGKQLANDIQATPQVITQKFKELDKTIFISNEYNM